MITDFFLNLFFSVAEWVLSLFGDFGGLPTDITDAVEGIGSFFASTGAFLGALDHWFPVGPFMAVGVAALAVEVVIAMIRGTRVVKQLLPFQ